MFVDFVIFGDPPFFMGYVRQFLISNILTPKIVDINTYYNICNRIIKSENYESWATDTSIEVQNKPKVIGDHL